MAYVYCDFDTGADVNGGTSWADAEKTIEAALTTANPGDTILLRANATSETTNPDTLGATRTMTSSGTINFPVRVVGVKDTFTGVGPPGAADLAVKSGDQPVIEVTGAGNDMNFATDFTEWAFINIKVNDRYTFQGNTHLFHQCDLTCDNMLINNGTGKIIFVDTDITIGTDGDTGSGLGNQNGIFEIYGGSITSSLSHNYLLRTGGSGNTVITGCDLSGLTLSAGYLNTVGRLIIKNSRIDASPTLVGGTLSNSNSFCEMIACSNDTSLGSTASIQNYDYEDTYGTVTSDPTIVRTGGADDGATSPGGSFSYKLTPATNAVLEGSMLAIIWSPWMAVWVTGGSAITLTVYVTTNGGEDRTEEELLLQIHTPDAGDTATHDLNFDPPAIDFYSESTTNITDDASSTWVTHNTFKQAVSTTVTPGFEGFAYARVGYCKRDASGDSMWIDPKIEVT